MPDKQSGSEIFIVDNSDRDWKVREYLKEWADISFQFDIATGYFEIGSLLALDGKWQQLDKIRILMGDEMTKRTRRALVDALKSELERKLDDSLENEKEKNDFLKGVPAIVNALREKKIECRVFTKKKFHAKAYITHSKLNVVGSSALVGSSNFTFPGLTDNVELNIHEKQRVGELQEWYERHWAEAEDVTPEILRVIERHTREYQPFEIYAKALHEYFRGAEMTIGEWELKHSRIFNKVLDGYQREGYQALMKIAGDFDGAFLCDGVGLGKTFVGLMLIERLIEVDRKRVALLVPKVAHEVVWKPALKKYLPNLFGKFSNLEIFNHTDLSSRSERWQEEYESIKERADVIIIDEAHNFRNRNSRYQKLFELAEGKKMFLLTATPINNHLSDFQHMIELFSRRRLDYFKTVLGIHSLPSYFREKEKSLENLMQQRLKFEANAAAEMPEIETNPVEAEQILVNDKLFNALVVQRSRSYVRESQIKEGAAQTLFPRKQPPQIAEYSVKKTYGRLLGVLDKAFARKSPLFSLAVYHPEMYATGEQDTKLDNRQKQVVALIRTNFLKRFESSTYAFQKSCERLLAKLLAFVEKNAGDAEKSRLERWKAQKAGRLGFIRVGQMDLYQTQGDLGDAGDDDDEDFDSLVSEDLLEATLKLERGEYKVDEIINETFLDLDQIVDFLDELKKFKPASDDKLRALIKLLKTDPVLRKHKVLIFTEFKDTAQYLLEQFHEAGIEGAAKIDSSTKENRGKLIERFAPYYNGASSLQLETEGREEIRVLISTDVLSEGLNLQDATRLINYDLHWNPVRLMQRIGRVDRRLNPQIEAKLLAEHSDQKTLRGTIAYWNFLPPDELDDLLKLYERVARKTLRISRTFGIEGRQLLKPTDEFDDLRDFLHAYEGERTTIEDLRLEYKELLKTLGLAEKLDKLPQRIFSGKAHPAPDAQAIFFCYRLPVQPTERAENNPEESDALDWSTDEGRTAWYLYDLTNGQIEEEPAIIVNALRSLPDTSRRCVVAAETLSEIRAKVEKHIKNNYLKKVQAPAGVKPALKAWMEIS